MSMFKKANVVMLPTNEPSKIGNLVTYQKCNLAKVIKEGINPKDSTVQFWNLYIISDEKIKEGDWYIAEGKIYRASVAHMPELYKHSHKKIIATTDESLRTKYKENNHQPLSKYNYILPKPSDSFISKHIEEYNKGNIITDVLVEYNYFLDDNGVLPYWNLKVNPKDNTITIKKTKEIYTKDEVIRLLEKYISFLWKEIGIHYPISLGKDAKDKFINSEL